MITAAHDIGAVAPGVAATTVFHDPARLRCRVCGSVGPFVHYSVREMMFASGERFDYVLCGGSGGGGDGGKDNGAGCGCLQIVDVPPDLARHYGEGYYSFGARPPSRGLRGVLARARNRYLSGRSDPLGWALAVRKPYLALAALRPLRLPRDARIVDVGCGGGELLLALQSAGFTRLLGVDPFVAHDLDLGGGLRVRRSALAGIDGPADLVMFHHSLEHMADQQGNLRAAHALLVPGGRCVVRIPTVSAWAWRHYGTDWCALDAPRHLVLHSRASIRRLAEACGFVVEGIRDDSTAFQCWGSEQYRRGIALMRAGCHDIVPAPGAFTAATLRGHARKAAQLNQAGDGDQIVVSLRRPFDAGAAP